MYVIWARVMRKVPMTQPTLGPTWTYRENHTKTNATPVSSTLLEHPTPWWRMGESATLFDKGGIDVLHI